MSRLRYQSFLLLAPLFFLLLNFGLVFGNTLWAENPVARFTWTAENANSNRTGLGLPHAVYGVVYERSVSGQLVHSSFALNTNSCASCHITHQAPGSRLLFQRSIYNTCSTCHFDPTINAYNVLTGLAPGPGPGRATAGGGRFFDGDFAAQTGERRGVSFHLATGAVEHWQAPGSRVNSQLEPAGSPWRQPFTCASCHGPHGTYSQRHLHFNVNGQARRFNNIPLEPVVGQTYWTAPVQGESRAPWLYYERDTALFLSHGLLIKNYLGVDVTEAFRVNHQLGRVWLDQPSQAGPGPYTISFSQATVVDLEVQNAGTTLERTVYRGGVVNFCTACHTGYLQRREVGGRVYLYTQHANFAHPIDSDINSFVASRSIADPPTDFRLEHEGTERQLVCLSCHFAHGTDAERMMQSDFTASVYPAGSTQLSQTSLLRFGSEANGNREVCLVCHAFTDSRLSDNLTVLSTQPTSGANGATENIIINFDRRVDLASVSLRSETVSGSLRVYGSVYGSVAGSVSLSNDFRTLVFVPSLPLPSQQYTVELFVPPQPTIRSWFGRILAELYSFDFTVP